MLTLYLTIPPLLAHRNPKQKEEEKLIKGGFMTKGRFKERLQNARCRWVQAVLS